MACVKKALCRFAFCLFVFGDFQSLNKLEVPLQASGKCTKCYKLTLFE